MTTRKKFSPDPNLLERALERLAREPEGQSVNPKRDNDYEQTLAIHQVELELQNEELRAARLELEAGLDRYTQLFDFAPIGYATLTPDGTVRELNHVGATLLYENRSQLIGKRFTLFVSPSSRAAFNELLEKALENEGKEVGQFELISVSDERPMVRITAVTLAGADPTILIAFEDITAQKRAEDRMLRADLALREADRRKDEFLAVLSHELRTPLSTLLMYGQLLRHDGIEPEKVRMAAEAIERAARIQARLIDDLLDVSRIVAGKLNMELGQVSLVSVARAALDAVMKDAEKKGISLQADFDAVAPMVFGDSERLQQVLTNLLNNAIKFTPAAGQIRLALHTSNGSAIIRVEDTGAGIAPDFLPHIFERFSQADRSMTRATGGLGLGLSIARWIVEAHQGTIRAQSAGRGRGAAFTISLPVGIKGSQAAAEPKRPSRQDGAESKIKGRRLLVVEDDDTTRETLTEVLTMAGAEVRGADGGAAAMEVLNDFHPDVLVCDIGMPGEDGCDLLRRIRTHGPEHGRGIRALALTAFAGDDDRERTKAAGFETHLVKPVDIEQLIAAVSELLPRSETQHTAAN